MLPPKDWIFRLILLAGLMVLAAGGIYAAHRFSQRETEQRTLAEQLAKTRHAAREIEGVLNRLGKGIDSLVQSRQFRQKIAIDQEILEHFISNYPPGLLLGICQQDGEGNILAEYPPGWLSRSGFPVGRIARFNPEAKGPRLITAPPGPAIQLIETVKNENTASQLNALISLEPLQHQIPDDHENGFMFILDHSGKILLHPERKLIGLDFHEVVQPGNEPEDHDLLVKISSSTANAGMIPEPLLGMLVPHPAGRKLALSFVPLKAPGGSWRLAYANSIPGLEVIGNTHLAKLFIFAFGVICMILIFNSPVRQLATGARRGSQLSKLENDLEQLQAQLAAAELRNQQLLDNAGDALFFVDPVNGAILDQNQVCEKLLGYSGNELTRLSLSVLLPGRQHRKYLRLLKKVLNSGYGEESELQFRTKSGKFFTGAVHARLGSLDNRQVVHGVIRDVTRLKQIEQELRQRNRDLTLINQITFKAAESSSLGDVLDTVRAMVVAAFKADGGGIYLSRHQGNQLELVTHEGIPDDILSELKTLPPGKGLIGRVLVSGRPVASADLKNDRRLWSETIRQSDWRVLQSVPLVTREQTIGVMFVFHRKQLVYSRDDIRLLQAIGQQVGLTIAGADLLEELTWQNRLTEATNRELQASRKLLSENLKKQKEATRILERTEQMKNSFLALASHELRTPLTYILSGSQLLLDNMNDSFSEQQQKLLQAVHQGGKRLEEIVKNLLEIARLEAQSIYLGKEPIDLKILLHELCQTFHSALADNRLTLKVKPLPVVDTLLGDRDHLFNTLSRLLENAIKFTPQGGTITITAQLLTRKQVIEQKELLQTFREQFFRQDLAPRYLQLTFDDTGIGIDPNDQLQIFDKFYEVGDIHSHFTSRTRFGGKGVGLGLALVKGMIEAHNGVVWVESSGTEVGGSSFHLLLPLEEHEMANSLSAASEAELAS